MAGPIVVASALARLTPVRCPWCGYRKLVSRPSQPVAYRVCPRCKKHFPDPLTTKPKKR